MRQARSNCLHPSYLQVVDGGDKSAAGRGATSPLSVPTVAAALVTAFKQKAVRDMLAERAEAGAGKAITAAGLQGPGVAAATGGKRKKEAAEKEAPTLTYADVESAALAAAQEVILFLRHRTGCFLFFPVRKEVEIFYARLSTLPATHARS